MYVTQLTMTIIYRLKDNEIVDSGSLQGDHIHYTDDRYMQVNLTVNIRDDFWEVVQ